MFVIVVKMFVSMSVPQLECLNSPVRAQDGVTGDGFRLDQPSPPSLRPTGEQTNGSLSFFLFLSLFLPLSQSL